MSDYEKAIADYDQAIRLDPQDPRGLRQPGQAWYSKGDFEKAIADYDHAIRLDPRNPHAYSHAGPGLE